MFSLTRADLLQSRPSLENAGGGNPFNEVVERLGDLGMMRALVRNEGGLASPLDTPGTIADNLIPIVAVHN